MVRPKNTKTAAQRQKELIARKKRERAQLFQKIIADSKVQDALDLLVAKGCDLAFVKCYLTEPIVGTEAAEVKVLADTADQRKTDLNSAKQFKKNLERTRKLASEFHKWTGEPMEHLDMELVNAIKQVQPWADNPRPRLLFTPRQNQQFRLIEHIRRQVRQWHFGEAATLLAAVYSVRGVPKREWPSRKSIEYLAKAFRRNREKRRKSRLKKQPQ